MHTIIIEDIPSGDLNGFVARAVRALPDGASLRHEDSEEEEEEEKAPPSSKPAPQRKR